MALGTMKAAVWSFKIRVRGLSGLLRPIENGARNTDHTKPDKSLAESLKGSFSLTPFAIRSSRMSVASGHRLREIRFFFLFLLKSCLETLLQDAVTQKDLKILFAFWARPPSSRAARHDRISSKHTFFHWRKCPYLVPRHCIGSHGRYSVDGYEVNQQLERAPKIG